MERIEQVIAAALKQDPSLSDEQISQSIFERVRKAELLPLLTAEVRRQRRSIVLPEEREFFAKFAETKVNPERHEVKRAEVSAAWLRAGALLRKQFALGDGERVEWGRATVQQHEARIAYLTKMRDGIGATITEHRNAIALIQESGVECLDDVFASEAAA